MLPNIMPYRLPPSPQNKKQKQRYNKHLILIRLSISKKIPDNIFVIYYKQSLTKSYISLNINDIQVLGREYRVICTG